MSDLSSGTMNEARIERVWVISAHALIRYVERVRPGISYSEAARELEHHLAGAHPVKQTGESLELWRGPKRGPDGRVRRLRFRVRRHADRLELVTVLGAFDR